MRRFETVRSSHRPTRGTIAVAITSESSVLRKGIRAMLAPERDMRIVGEAATIPDARRLMTAHVPDLLVVALLTNAAEGLSTLRVAPPPRVDLPVILIARPPDPTEVWLRPVTDWLAYVGLNVAPRQMVDAVRRAARGERVVYPPGLERLRNPPPTLSAPEVSVLRLLSDGNTNREIAQHLRYSVGTVKDYVQRILEKLEVSNRTQAAVKAFRDGVLEDATGNFPAT